MVYNNSPKRQFCGKKENTFTVSDRVFDVF